MSTTGKSRGGRKTTSAKSSAKSSARSSAKSSAKTSAKTSATASPKVETPEPSALWHRLVTAVRGGVNELGEVFADTQALRILDQEIRDNDAELHRTRAAQAETMARCKVAQEHLAAANTAFDTYETYALKALKGGEEALAREVAAKIALIEIERNDHAGQVQHYTDGIADLRKTAAQLESNIKRLKQQVDTVRATESVQRAQAAVAQRRQGSDVRVRTALDSLERIKRRQSERGVRLDAGNTMAVDDVLDAKLRQAGIIADDDRTEAVLARLKKQYDD